MLDSLFNVNILLSLKLTDAYNTVHSCFPAQFLWSYKLNLTQDFQFESAAQDLCGDALKQVSC